MQQAKPTGRQTHTIPTVAIGSLSSPGAETSAAATAVVRSDTVGIFLSIVAKFSITSLPHSTCVSNIGKDTDTRTHSRTR